MRRAVDTHVQARVHRNSHLIRRYMCASAGSLIPLVATQVYLPERFRLSAWNLRCVRASNNGISSSCEKEEKKEDDCALPSATTHHFNLTDLLSDQKKSLERTSASRFFLFFPTFSSLAIERFPPSHSDRVISLIRTMVYRIPRNIDYLRPPTYDGGRYTLRHALHFHPLP